MSTIRGYWPLPCGYPCGRRRVVLWLASISLIDLFNDFLTLPQVSLFLFQLPPY
jgi:hypothetical protein